MPVLIHFHNLINCTTNSFKESIYHVNISPVQKACDVCSVCNQPIKGDSVVSNNKVFHPECMKCYVCGDGLRGTYFTFEDKPICEMHYKVSSTVFFIHATSRYFYTVT